MGKRNFLAPAVIIGRNCPGQHALFERFHKCIIEIIFETQTIFVSIIDAFNYIFDMRQWMNTSCRTENNAVCNVSQIDLHIHVLNVRGNFHYINAFICSMKSSMVHQFHIHFMKLNVDGYSGFGGIYLLYVGFLWWHMGKIWIIMEMNIAIHVYQSWYTRYQ